MTSSLKSDEEDGSAVASTGSRRRADDPGGSQAMTMAAEGGAAMAPTFDSNPGMRLEDEGELAPGQIIGEHYKVDRRIGAGAMGSVYVVEHLGLGKRFAVKVVAAAKASDIGAVTRLRNEARTLSALDHENIVGVSHLGQTDDGRLFVVMDLLEGEDLGMRLHRQHQQAAKGQGAPWLPLEEVRFIVPQLLNALSAAHQAHVVHRDLKPDNLFLSNKRGRVVVKVVDFGISKIRGGSFGDAGLTQTGQILGTPLYMAPEQGRSTAGADARADIYSVGCILYELFTARPPFVADSVYDCVVKHATTLPDPPSRHRSDIPAAIEALIVRCLEKKPEDRYSDTDTLIEAWNDAWDAIDRGEEPLLPEPPAAAISTDYPSPAPSTLSSTSGVVPVAAATTLDGTKRVAPWIGLGAVLAFALAAAFVGATASGEEDVVASAPAPSVSLPAAEVEPEPEPPREVAVPVAVPVAAPVAVEVVTEAVVETRTLVSVPAGAEVYRDGERLGVTPLAVEVPADGTVTVELRRRGFRSANRRLGVDDAERVTVRLRRRASGAPPLAPQ